MSAEKITLVIPGRNVAHVIGKCLDSVVPLLNERLVEIVFVDDGSTDATAEIVQSMASVRYIRGPGQGPGAARNVGWRSATTPLVWFVDADCVAEPDALQQLLTLIDQPQVAGVGGSYGNMFPNSPLACLIHEEIIERHLRMPERVNFLATFNVLYRRDVLEEVGGFDEELKLAQDAELAFRIRAAGHELRFQADSRVRHHHPVNIVKYLKTQARQGYYRVLLYLRHPTRMSGDSYSGLVDHVQPPLAMATLGSLLFLPFAAFRFIPVVLLIALIAVQLPMTFRIVARLHRVSYLTFAPMSLVRSLARGLGMSAAVITEMRSMIRRRRATA